MKSGNLNFLEPSGPLQACNGTDLPLFHRKKLYLPNIRQLNNARSKEKKLEDVPSEGETTAPPILEFKRDGRRCTAAKIVTW